MGPAAAPAADGAVCPLERNGQLRRQPSTAKIIACKLIACRVISLLAVRGQESTLRAKFIAQWVKFVLFLVPISVIPAAEFPQFSSVLSGTINRLGFWPRPRLWA